MNKQTSQPVPAALGRLPWRPPMAMFGHECMSRHSTSRWPMWPVHDLLATEILAWILPTHMWSHLIRFGAGLVLLWGSLMWILLGQEVILFEKLSFPSSTNEAMDGDDLPERLAPIQMLLCVVVCSLSLIWIYWYCSSVLYAIGKPWMNPQIPSFQRLEMHVPLRLFNDVDKARRAACLPQMVAWNATPPIAPSMKESGREESAEGAGLTRNVVLLDTFGSWQFQLLSTVEEGLALVQNDMDQSTDANDWSSIQVPGHWMLQGFPDIPIYTNKKYPFPSNPPIVPRQNPTGVYKLPIVFPDVWDPVSGSNNDDEEYSILLHGIESACFVYWNGRLLGFCKDSRLPSEFAIPSELLQSSSRTSAVLHLVMARWSDGSYMEDQDHWWMAGLHRSVELIRRPARADILDYRVQAPASREIQVAVQLRNHHAKTTSRSRACSVTARLYEDCQLTPDGDCWRPAQEYMWSQTKQVLNTTDDEHSVAATTTVVFQSTSLPQVQLWTAETPKLYTLLLIQSDDITGETLQVESCRVGFRSMDIRKDGILRVNGERITICGINRHEHDPDHGKVVSLDRMKQDIVALKQNNFNAVRTSHYPTHQSFYRLCDFYGMYVCDEANVETDGMKPMGRLANDWGWEDAFVSRVKRMIQRDFNHPCIILWSLGNESGRGRNLRKARKAVLELDRTRPICYEGGGSWTEGVGTTELTDVVCPMYPAVHLTEGLARQSDQGRPIILCEYSHSMNNSNGNLHLYWEAFWNPLYPRLQGGFIWDMIDQGLRKYDGNGREYYAYGGDFGDVINDRQFCINGMFSPEREPHPSVSEIKYLQQPAAISLPDLSSSVIVKVPREPGTMLGSLMKPPTETPLVILKVLNRYVFQDLSHLTWKWNMVLEYQPGIKMEGFATLSGDTLVIGCSSIFSCLANLESQNATGAVFLNVNGMLASDQFWAPIGHILVAEQFTVELQFEPAAQLQYDPSKGTGSIMACPLCLPLYKPILDPDQDSRLTAWQDASSILVSRGEHMRPFVVIDKKSGSVKSIFLKGHNLLHGNGIQPNFTRATTDNDRGGMELVLDFLRLPWAKPLFQAVNRHLFSYEMHWRDHGISQDAPPSTTCNQITVVRGADRTGDSVCVQATCSIRNVSGRVILSSTHAYTIFSDGRIRVDVKVTPNDSMRHIPSLPRLGLSLCLRKEFYRVRYFGRGPHENYSDRKSGAPMGVWQTSAAKMGFDYIVPSENGSRSDCKWASFNSDQGRLIVLTDSDSNLFNFSALVHTADELHRATHTCDIERRIDGGHPVHVNIDHRIMGIGGDVSWFPCVYSDFLVKPVEYEYSLWFLLSANDKSPEEVVSHHMRYYDSH